MWVVGGKRGGWGASGTSACLIVSLDYDDNLIGSSVVQVMELTRQEASWTLVCSMSLFPGAAICAAIDDARHSWLVAMVKTCR